jgi:hypothetical protein
VPVVEYQIRHDEIHVREESGEGGMEGKTYIPMARQEEFSKLIFYGGSEADEGAKEENTAK